MDSRNYKVVAVRACVRAGNGTLMPPVCLFVAFCVLSMQKQERTRCDPVKGPRAAASWNGVVPQAPTNLLVEKENRRHTPPIAGAKL